MATVLVHYAEIGLKKGNLAFFENQLIKNINTRLGKAGLKAVKSQKQILLTGVGIDLEKLKQVFGIAWFAPVVVVKRQWPLISQAALKLVRPKKTFAVRAHHEWEIKLGDAIRIKKKLKVDLDHPEQTIYLTQFNDQLLLYNQKLAGPGGLPVGTAGKVLCLLSGGFDSIAAAYLLAKRGAQVDFLHFHVFPDGKRVLQTKIKTIIKQLSQWSLSSRLFLASYLPFQLTVMDLARRDEPQELVVYRRLMVQVGEELAKKHGYQALVLGDSLGQVASQTLENICAVDQAVRVPIFRPLLGMDKKDIIALVRKIGLESITNQPYKDCCSLISTHPATRANLIKLQALEKRIRIEAIVKKIAQDVPVITL